MPIWTGDADVRVVVTMEPTSFVAVTGGLPRGNRRAGNRRGANGLTDDRATTCSTLRLLLCRQRTGPQNRDCRLSLLCEIRASGAGSSRRSLRTKRERLVQICLAPPFRAMQQCGRPASSIASPHVVDSGGAAGGCRRGPCGGLVAARDDLKHHAGRASRRLSGRRVRIRRRDFRDLPLQARLSEGQDGADRFFGIERLTRAPRASGRATGRGGRL
jgi:hypothetical protein